MTKNNIMNFKFLPYPYYPLNAHISYFRRYIEHSSSEEGIDMYRVKNWLRAGLFRLSVIEANLYFHEDYLVTVYCHLNYSNRNLQWVKTMLEALLNKPPNPITDGDSAGIYWKSGNEILALVLDKDSLKMYLYYSLLKYSVISDKTDSNINTS